MDNQLILEKQDLRHLVWSKWRKSSGTTGSFLKSYSELGGHKLYYKLSDYDPLLGVVGHECVNELIVDRLLTILGIEHLRYQIIHASILVDGKEEDTYLCASKDFKQPGEDKSPLDEYYALNKFPAESPLEFCIRQGWGPYIYQMLVVDFLILNRDRHGANIEVLRDKKNKNVHLAPLFDHGLSLLFRCRSEKEIASFDVMEDHPIQSFVGSRSARGNLSLIPVDAFPVLHPLTESHRSVLLEGLNGVIQNSLQDKIWNMIWERWCSYETFRGSR